jgi:hypothetical protein
MTYEYKYDLEKVHMTVIKEPTKGHGPFLNQRHMSPKFKHENKEFKLRKERIIEFRIAG